MPCPRLHHPSNFTPQPGHKVISVAYKVALVDIHVRPQAMPNDPYLLGQTLWTTPLSSAGLSTPSLQDKVYHFHRKDFIFLRNPVSKNRGSECTYTHSYSFFKSLAGAAVSPPTPGARILSRRTPETPSPSQPLGGRTRAVGPSHQGGAHIPSAPETWL